MTTLELTLNLPDRLAREAESAGLLTSAAISHLLKDAMRQRAAQALLDGAARATRSGSKPKSMRQMQEEVDAVRRANRSKKTPANRTVKSTLFDPKDMFAASRSLIAGSKIVMDSDGIRDRGLIKMQR